MVDSFEPLQCELLKISICIPNDMKCSLLLLLSPEALGLGGRWSMIMTTREKLLNKVVQSSHPESHWHSSSPCHVTPPLYAWAGSTALLILVSSSKLEEKKHCPLSQGAWWGQKSYKQEETPWYLCAGGQGSNLNFNSYPALTRYFHHWLDEKQEMSIKPEVLNVIKSLPVWKCSGFFIFSSLTTHQHPGSFPTNQ